MAAGGLKGTERHSYAVFWHVQVDDLIVVDGGMVSLSVVSKAGPDVVARVVDPGLILSRANLTFQRDGRIVRARNAMLPVLSSKVTHEAPCPCTVHP